MNPLPVTVTSVRWPAITWLGDTDSAAAGGVGGGSTGTACARESPPPGAGVNTVACASPALCTSPSGICAVSREGSTKLVGRSTPFQRTTDADEKPLPSTVRVNGPTPCTTCSGVTNRISGTRCSTGSATLLEAPPNTDGFSTLICPTPTCCSNAAGISAVSAVVLMNEVGSAVSFQRTTDCGAKPAPCTASVVCVLHSSSTAGASALTDGAGTGVGWVPPPPPSPPPLQPARVTS